MEGGALAPMGRGLKQKSPRFPGGFSVPSLGKNFRPETMIRHAASEVNYF